jgi:ribonuclease HI
MSSSGTSSQDLTTASSQDLPTVSSTVPPTTSSTTLQKPIQVYFDGGSKNPGPSGSGTLIKINGKPDIKLYRYIGDHHTNNEAEYDGLIHALEYLSEEYKGSQLIIHGDSKLVIEQMSGKWKINAPNLKPLHEKAKGLEQNFSKVTYNHIARFYNSVADDLANFAITNSFSKKK